MALTGNNGGDHALAVAPDPATVVGLPGEFALALCRIEPENNVAMILEGFAQLPDHPLVFVGNWDNSEYGRVLRKQYSETEHIHLLDPVYDPGALRHLRDRAWLYVHGHSAGGTNPSLVEMMHFAIPILAHECEFNQYTTEGKASYFRTARELADRVRAIDSTTGDDIGQHMLKIARARYVWAEIGKAYYEVLESQ